MSSIRNLEGKQIYEWTILKELGAGKVICRCSCGVHKELYKKCLLEGRTKSCGHNRKTNPMRGRIITNFNNMKE